MLLVLETLVVAVVTAVLATLVWLRHRERKTRRYFLALIVLRLVVAATHHIAQLEDPSIPGLGIVACVRWSLLPLIQLSMLLFFVAIYFPERLERRALRGAITAYAGLSLLLFTDLFHRTLPSMPLLLLASPPTGNALAEPLPHPALLALFNLGWLPILGLLGSVIVRKREERRSALLVLFILLGGLGLSIASARDRRFMNGFVLFDLLLTGALAGLLLGRRVFETTRVALDWALASMTQGIAVVSTDQEVLLANPAMTYFFGLREGRPLLAETGPDVEPRLLCDFLGTLPTEREIQVGELALAVSAIPLQDDAGVLRAHLFLVHDVTETRTYEHTLERRNAELVLSLRTQEEAISAKAIAEAASLAKSQFVARMSHELRTPLNAILGFVQLLLRDRGLTAPQRESLEVIGRSGGHLLGLINDILELSRIEAGHLVLAENDFDLHRLLGNLEEMLGVRAEDKGLALSVTWQPDVPRYVHADEGKLQQVLINIVGNAVKFTDAGRVSVEVACATVAPAGRRGLRFVIADTGRGIAPEDQKRLFQPFFQGQGLAGPTATEGTGLGLSISREFVALMGGTITVTSRLEVGTTFTVEVPVLLGDAARVRAEQGGLVVGLVPGQPTYRILVCDDRWENRDLLLRLLTSVGFEVCSATNGQEALATWETWAPHLIWMDMRMPVMDGYEATQRIKATLRGQATVIIALTASAFEHDRSLVLAAGCNDFVRKPFRESEIFGKMAEHLGVRFCYEADADQEPAASGASHLAEPQGADGTGATDSSAALAAASDAAPPPVTNMTLPLKGSVASEAAVIRALAGLPAEQRTALAQAALQLNARATQSVLESVRTHDAALARALAELVDSYRFDILLAWIERSERPS